MTTNADITIFNKRYVREERTEKFVATQIRGEIGRASCRERV